MVSLYILKTVREVVDFQKNHSFNCTNLPVWPEWLTPTSASVVSCVEERLGLGGAEVGDKEDPAAVGFVPDEGSVIEPPEAVVVSGSGIGGVAIIGVSAIFNSLNHVITMYTNQNNMCIPRKGKSRDIAA